MTHQPQADPVMTPSGHGDESCPGPEPAGRSRWVATIRRALAPVVGRNDRCPCGSGRKFKGCCLRARQVAMRP